jgi:Domain of unknown function (DUF4159)
MRASRLRGGVVVALLAGTAGYAYAQFGPGFGGFGFDEAVRWAPSDLPDRNFTVCRIMYTSVRREPNGGGWRTDYPYGEINLMTRLSELTRTPVSFNAAKRPLQWVVRLTDDALFNCPYIVASDVGTIGLTQQEASKLRLYLEKGGFLWVDDFWGAAAWAQWTRELSKALPPSEFPIEDVPLSDPIFSTQFTVTKIPQITNIQFWRQWGGSYTSERGEDSDEVHLRAIRDAHRRIIVLMSHNTDVADSWEREGEDPEFFYQFSPRGYALGVDVLLHAMTH